MGRLYDLEKRFEYENGGPGWNKCHLGKSSTFQAEMYMIFRAAEWIKLFIHRYPGVYEVYIYTDNQACVYALASHETKSNLVGKTVLALNDAMNSTAVQICISWVKGHSGCAGNDRADDVLANLGRLDQSNPVADIPAFPLNTVNPHSITEQWIFGTKGLSDRPRFPWLVKPAFGSLTVDLIFLPKL